MKRSIYPKNPVVQCLPMHNVDFDIDQAIAETIVLLDYVPIFDPEDSETLEIELALGVDPDPIV
ncbi:hypothetical protein FRX31_016418 [Thalictrum thalictroides]|uniref:Uncharacterized protein n=1 Tax=Thalictrum thalictroides TaxID=46969 RepID=A0A7J6W990_THATH|nr:hypothetical protein FRX31_016418 [Thalictrum thalictroides]